LESNWFWKASGYIVVGEVVSTWLNQRESKTKRPLFVYQKCFAPLFPHNNANEADLKSNSTRFY